MGDIITTLQNTPVPTILIVGGIVFLFLAVVGQFVRQVPSWAGTIGALLLFSGVALYVLPVCPSSEEIPSSAVVKITSHSDQATVPRVAEIKGQYENVPKCVDIWLYVYAPAIQRYFVEPVIKRKDGTWEVKRVIVGSISPSDVGAAFKIGVLLANKKASKQLRDDLESLPNGTEKRDEIVVYRE